MNIKTLKFKGVQKLHERFFQEGYDACKGCEYEYHASCHKDRMKVCKVQLQKVIDMPDQMKRPCWWEH